MPATPSASGQSLAARLRPLLRSRKAKLTVGEMIDKLDGDGGLGPTLFVLTLPVIMPLPPGVSMVLALPLLEKVETVVRPRLGALTGRVGACLAGLACTMLAIVLVLPIPFANLVPALALGALSLGLTRKDGLMVLAGYGLIALAGAVIALGVHGVFIGVGRLEAALL